MEAMMKRDAEISEDKVYRYSLKRCWDKQLPSVLWVMLNPSKADAYQDDHTITMCIHFSESWGYGKLEVGNLFALRSTDPTVLKDHPNHIGPLNDEWLKDMAKRADRVVAAWGDHGSTFPNRIRQVLPILGPEVYALSVPNESFLTKKQQPRHPSRVSKSADLKLWNPSR
jgi:hypothetical protein